MKLQIIGLALPLLLALARPPEVGAEPSRYEAGSEMFSKVTVQEFAGDKCSGQGVEMDAVHTDADCEFVGLEMRSCKGLGLGECVVDVADFGERECSGSDSALRPLLGLEEGARQRRQDLFSARAQCTAVRGGSVLEFKECGQSDVLASVASELACDEAAPILGRCGFESLEKCWGLDTRRGRRSSDDGEVLCTRMISAIDVGVMSVNDGVQVVLTCRAVDAGSGMDAGSIGGIVVGALVFVGALVVGVAWARGWPARPRWPKWWGGARSAGNETQLQLL